MRKQIPATAFGAHSESRGFAVPWCDAAWLAGSKLLRRKMIEEAARPRVTNVRKNRVRQLRFGGVGFAQHARLS